MNFRPQSLCYNQYGRIASLYCFLKAIPIIPKSISKSIILQLSISPLFSRRHVRNYVLEHYQLNRRHQWKQLPQSSIELRYSLVPLQAPMSLLLGWYAFHENKCLMKGSSFKPEARILWNLNDSHIYSSCSEHKPIRATERKGSSCIYNALQPSAKFTYHILSAPKEGNSTINHKRHIQISVTGGGKNFSWQCPCT